MKKLVRKDYEEALAMRSGLTCDRCEAEVTECDMCNEEFDQDGDIVYCFKKKNPKGNPTHICQNCFKKI